MQRRPSLVIAAVDVGAVLHQELDHIQVVVDAGLRWATTRCRQTGHVNSPQTSLKVAVVVPQRFPRLLCFSLASLTDSWVCGSITVAFRAFHSISAATATHYGCPSRVFYLWAAPFSRKPGKRRKKNCIRSRRVLSSVDSRKGATDETSISIA